MRVIIQRVREAAVSVDGRETGRIAHGLLVLAGIIVSLVISAWPAITKFGWGFIIHSDWNPPMEKFGALIPIYGTLATSLIALVIAVPVSFGIALFLTELSPVWLRRPLGVAIELLAAVPSIIYGMFGLFVFAPIFADYIQVPMQEIIGGMPLIGWLAGSTVVKLIENFDHWIAF